VFPSILFTCPNHRSRFSSVVFLADLLQKSISVAHFIRFLKYTLCTAQTYVLHT
jgi:hypothetical protein